jgi:hypothetical protein
VILMHMRGTPQTMTTLHEYPTGVIPEVAAELATVGNISGSRRPAEMSLTMSAPAAQAASATLARLPYRRYPGSGC